MSMIISWTPRTIYNLTWVKVRSTCLRTWYVLFVQGYLYRSCEEANESSPSRFVQGGYIIMFSSLEITSVAIGGFVPSLRLRSFRLRSWYVRYWRLRYFSSFEEANESFFSLEELVRLLLEALFLFFVRGG